MAKYSIVSLTLVLLLLLSVGTEGFIREEQPEHDTWPWMVYIWHGHGKQDGDVIGCAGSLISNYHVLTSPYCVQHDSDEGQLHDDIDGLTLRMGDNHLGDLLDLSDGHPTVTRMAIKVYVHSLWQDNDQDVTIKANEIAIIVMNESVDFSHSIQPIKIAAANLNLSGMSAVVAGWGQMRALIAANATILDDKHCSWDTNYTWEPQLNFANQEEAIKILTRALEKAESITQTPKEDDMNTSQILEATDKIPKEADKNTDQILEATNNGTAQIPKATEGATQYYELSTAVGTIIIDPKQSEPGNYQVLNSSEPTSATDPMRNETNLLIGIALSRGNNCSRKNGTDTIDYDSCQPVPSRIDKHLEKQYTRALWRLPKYSVRQTFPVRTKVAQSDKDSLMCTDFLGLSCTPCTGDVGGPLVINFPRNKSRHHQETGSVESGTSKPHAQDQNVESNGPQTPTTTGQDHPGSSTTNSSEPEISKSPDQDKNTEKTEPDITKTNEQDQSGNPMTNSSESDERKKQPNEPRTSEGTDHVQPTNTSQEPVPQIVGIIVHNPFCNTYNETIFYTKVSYFNQWIHNITGPIIDGSAVDIASIEPELFNRLQTIASQEATNQPQTTASQEGTDQSQTKADNDTTDNKEEPTEDPLDDIGSNLIANGTPIGTTGDTNKDTSEESPGNKTNNPANGGCNSDACKEDVNDKKKDLWTSRMIKLIIAVIIFAATIVAVYYAKRDSEKEDRRRNLFQRKRRLKGKTSLKSPTENRGKEQIIATTETNNDPSPIKV